MHAIREEFAYVTASYQGLSCSMTVICRIIPESYTLSNYEINVPLGETVSLEDYGLSYTPIQATVRDSDYRWVCIEGDPSIAVFEGSLIRGIAVGDVTMELTLGTTHTLIIHVIDNGGGGGGGGSGAYIEYYGNQLYQDFRGDYYYLSLSFEVFDLDETLNLFNSFINIS